MLADRPTSSKFKTCTLKDSSNYDPIDYKHMKNNKKDYNTINNLSKFSYGLIVTESILMLLFAIFVRMDNNPSNDSLSTERMLGFLATNMMAVGFALFMSSGLYHQFTPITFSLLVVVLAWQMHILMYALW